MEQDSSTSASHESSTLPYVSLLKYRASVYLYVLYVQEYGTIIDGIDYLLTNLKSYE